ncbi:MAG TPA: hypothetical protein ENH94_04760 [Phycisphaerales bacterium]|nr:hypothetical protein [Phycisphaerales bacterium]
MSSTSKRRIAISVVIFVSLISVSVYAQPFIDVWYGLDQSFGHIGKPQEYINIFGNASGSNSITSLSYSLNGGSQIDLSIGPDGRRLAYTGDFNIDILCDDLAQGNNVVTITATDTAFEQTVQQVNVTFDSSNIWPLPFVANWGSVTEISQVAQVVDGGWLLQGDNVLTAVSGYDRLVAIGDVSWTDYEVLVPITIYDGMGYSGGVGVLLRWTGHTDSPLSGWQPKTGWFPLGAVTWFRRDLLEILGNDNAILGTKVKELVYGTTYMLRARVETMDGQGDIYSMKVWEQGQAEPVNWDIVGEAQQAEPAAGSLMLIAHYANASFGKVEITPIGMKNIRVDVTDTTATVNWYTGLPSDSFVEYGTSSNYTDSAYDAANVTSHSITLTGFLPNTLYHFKVTSVDTDGVISSLNDMTFVTTGPENSGIVSDDFNSESLDPNTWTFHNPVGDCSYELVGTDTKDAWLTLSVPGGTGHDVWKSGNDSARIMQETLDVDFEVEVKFESDLNKTYQLEGIIIEQDPDNYLRFDFYRNGGNVRNFVARFKGYSVSVKKNKVIPDINPNANPIYMRVRREGDVWTQWYSHDGFTWIESLSFSYPMTVNSVGPFAGNAIRTASPDFDCYIDYFFNTAAPVVPEDNWFPPPERFAAYIDLNAQANDNNHENVTAIVPPPYTPDYIPPAIHPYVNWTLKDFDTGIDLDVTMNVTMDIETPVSEGDGSGSLTDAQMTFGGIVDGSGGYEMIAPDDYFMITFDNLDPTKEYELAMTYNNAQAGYANRVSMLTLWDADTYTQASSSGVYINSEDSVSVGFGANTTNGYVARWTEITASDGSFSVIAEHDDSFGGPAGYAMTSVMLKHMPVIDITPPVIGNIETVTTETTAQITFTTDEPATCSVACGPTTAYENGSVTDGSLVTNHSVTLNNLQSGTTYHFQVTGTDESGNAAQSADLVFTTVATVAAFSDGFGTYQSGDDPPGWFDTKAGNSLAQDDSLFKIMNAGDSMAFGTNSSLTNIHSHYVVGQSHEWTDYQYKGRVKITSSGAGVGLTFFSDFPNSDKYYRLRRYGSGSFHISPHGTSITSGNTSSGVKPQPNIWYKFVIEVENADTQTEIRAKIWQDGTTEPANWQIECQDANAGRLTEGTVGLWSMYSGTRYFDDLQVVPKVVIPDTTDPIIGNVQAAAGDIAATVTWTTDEPATSSVAFGPSAAYENGSVSTGSLVTNHSITLTSLTASTIYHYKVTSQDAAGNSAETADLTFTTTTPDTTGPVVTNIQAAPSGGSATITFTTNEPATSSVSCGPTTAYENGSTDGGMKTNHSITLTNLLPGTLYHYQVTCTDASSNEAVSADLTFTTSISTAIYSENFNAYQAGDDPLGWFDTGSGNSLAQDDSVFKVMDASGNKAFGTNSSSTNIHSHYVAGQSTDWTNYQYRGRMMIASSGAGIGLTFFSDFPNSDKYYRLRRYGSGSFHISPHGTSITSGNTSSGVKPVANIWYRFVIEVVDTGTQTEIRAKIWQDGTTEPGNWQIECQDANTGRSTKGTVGLWSMSSGTKYFDDLEVE